MDNLTFQKADENDLQNILDIYNYYIANSTALFDFAPVSKKEFLQRIFISHEKYPTYLILIQNEITGFCFLTQFQKKKAYDRTAEIGIYLKPQFTKRGFGKEAVAFLERVARDSGTNILVASISGENLASIKLFRKMGFEQCAHYKEIGEKFGRLIDVIDLQKIL